MKKSQRHPISFVEIYRLTLSFITFDDLGQGYKVRIPYIYLQEDTIFVGTLMKRSANRKILLQNLWKCTVQR